MAKTMALPSQVGLGQAIDQFDGATPNMVVVHALDGTALLAGHAGQDQGMDRLSGTAVRGSQFLAIAQQSQRVRTLGVDRLGTLRDLSVGRDGLPVGEDDFAATLAASRACTVAGLMALVVSS